MDCLENFRNGTCIVSATDEAPGTFISAVQFFAAAACFVQTKDWPPNYELQDGEEFDFIIVGAGAAGSVLANRLTENKDWNVLLLEAGVNPPIESDIPFLSTSMYGTEYDWQYKTVDNGRTNQAIKNGVVSWPRGKMLGGSSSINLMAYVQGSFKDYQSWYDEGNSEWHPEITRRYFKKAENLQDPILLKNPTIMEHYGQKGPLVVNSYNITLRDKTISNNVLSAIEEIGFKHVEDLNTVNNLGCGEYRVIVSEGKRVSTAVAYLNQFAKNRQNLKIGKKGFVTKILIDENLSAYGVEVNQNGKTVRLCARREVVLSAGSINSPKLLMLSGIGPKDHLESHNIDIFVNSPMVGKNLQDHTAIPVTIFANEPLQMDNATKHIEEMQYVYERKGYLSYSSFDSFFVFYAANKTQSYPDHQIVLMIHGKGSDTIKTFASIYVKSVENSILEQGADKALFQFVHVGLHPYTRGNISLNSRNPFDDPLIYYDNYSNLRDLDSTANGVKIFTKIIDSKYFRSIGAFLGRIKLEACDCHELDSVEYWKCIALNMAGTLYHPVGTTKMGNNIENSVVNSRLKVHGVSCLRVIDAGVMPTITSGNTMAPTIMIAERGADIIKEDHNQKQ